MQPAFQIMVKTCLRSVAGGQSRTTLTSSSNSTSEMRVDSTGRTYRTTECTAACTSYLRLDMGDTHAHRTSHTQHGIYELACIEMLIKVHLLLQASSA